MFSNLSESLSKIFSKIISGGILTEEAVDAAMREVRIALLEADVALPVVRSFIDKVREEAIGQKIVKSIRPDQLVIKIVQDELTKLLGEGENELKLVRGGLSVLMMVGLQGAGKTTSSAKLALKLKKNKKKILLASLDIARPGAQEQLKILAQKIDVESLEIIPNQDPITIAKRALDHAHRFSYDVLILDTAGRLHIDDNLMKELEEIKQVTKPVEVLLVADSMLGQDAVNIANNFNSRLNITGVILSRMDGDTKGGVALSMKFVTSCPIKFIGTGEKVEQLEEFHAERVAGRILDKGDVISLVEKATELLGQDDMKKLENDFKKGRFDLNDFKDYLHKTKKLGGINGIISMLPGINQIKKQLNENSLADELFNKADAAISSMTQKERKDPKILNGSRRNRIARGAGITVQDVNKIMNMYLQMSNLMKKFKTMDKKSFMKGGMQNILKSLR